MTSFCWQFLPGDWVGIAGLCESFRFVGSSVLSCARFGTAVNNMSFFWPKESLVAEWIHFTLWGIILPTIKLKVCTFWCL